MPDTRPGSIFKKGICQACRNYDTIKTIDWEKRKKKLFSYSQKFCKQDGSYDMIIPVSGGKDSHMLVYYFKEEIGMNPLLVTVADPFSKTKAGHHNLNNIRSVFNCDHFVFHIGTKTFRKATRIAFEKTGEPLKFVETAIYTLPFRLMINMNIPFMVFGEDSGFIYGTTNKESKFANSYIMNIFNSFNPDFWMDNGMSFDSFNCCIKPDESDIARVNPKVLFMSYFIPWNCEHNLMIARRYGFQDLYHEWWREGYHDHYQQIDSIAYMIHHWMKYPKFGYNRPMDIAGRDCREGRISIDKVKEITKDQWKIDQRALYDFCDFCGYSIPEFWDIVELHWNYNFKDNHYFKYFEHKRLDRKRR